MNSLEELLIAWEQNELENDFKIPSNKEFDYFVKDELNKIFSNSENADVKYNSLMSFIGLGNFLGLKKASLIRILNKHIHSNKAKLQQLGKQVGAKEFAISFGFSGLNIRFTWDV